MLDALTITEAEAAGLTELAALDLAMARDFAARARAEPDPQVATSLARSYQRAARSYRQTLALKARLARDMALAAAAAEAAHRETAPRAERIARRKAQLRSHLERVIWDELEVLDADDPEAAGVRAALEARLEAWSRKPGFEQEAPERLVDYILTELEPVFEAVVNARLDAEPDDAPAPPYESSA